MLEKLRLTSPKPGHAERVHTPLSPAPDHSHQRFLKINVRHITDGQVLTYFILVDISLEAQIMWHGCQFEVHIMPVVQNIHLENKRPFQPGL